MVGYIFSMSSKKGHKDVILECVETGSYPTRLNSLTSALVQRSIADYLSIKIKAI